MAEKAVIPEVNTCGDALARFAGPGAYASIYLPELTARLILLLLVDHLHCFLRTTTTATTTTRSGNPIHKLPAELL